MHLFMVDEQGRAVASGSGPAFLKSLHESDGRPLVSPMVSYAESGSTVHGHTPAPLLKSRRSPADEVEAVIADAQARFGRAQVLNRLDELGLI